MKEKIKIICLILITFSFLVGIVFYCWQVYKTQLRYQSEEQENPKIHQECMTRLKTGEEYVKQGLTSYKGIQEQLEFYIKCVKEIKEAGGLERYKEILSY